MNHPFWFRLIDTWCTNGRTGLTLPFIVGAEARACGIKAVPEDAQRILSEIQELRDSTVVSWCPTRGVPVIGTKKSAKEPFVHDSLKMKKEWNGDEKKILNDLLKSSEMHVRKGEFSKVGEVPYAKWQDFEPSELEFIDSVIGRKKG